MIEQWEMELREQLLDDRRLTLSDDSADDDVDDDVDDPKPSWWELLNKLERVADIMAEAGIIHNTPSAKRQWVEGQS